MRPETFVLTAGVIFLAVALLHALRLIFKWDAVIGPWRAPAWFSVAGLLIAGYLAYVAFRM